MIPKLFINVIAALPEKTEPSKSSIVNSGGNLPPRTMPQMLSPEETLPEEVIPILYKYDCGCVPLFENQLGTYQTQENLSDMWGVKSSPNRTVSHQVFQSVFQQLLLWIQTQPLLQPQAHHSLRISRGRTRSVTIWKVQVRLMSIFYLIQTFRQHSSKQFHPISRHPMARLLQFGVYWYWLL